MEKLSRCQTLGWVVVVASLAVGAREAWAKAEQPHVALADVDSLVLRFELPELLGYLEAQLGEVDRPEARRRKFKLARAYLGFWSTRQKIDRAREDLKIERALCALDSARATNTHAPDRVWLEARQKVLAQESALAEKIEQCQTYILDIMELVNGDILSHEEKKEETAAADPVRGRAQGAVATHKASER